MASYQLTVEQRTQTGKSYARQLRAEQKIPAVIYGSGNPATNIEVAVRAVENALSSQGSLIDLLLDGNKRTVIVKEVHRDPVRSTLQHVDFHEIDLSKKLEIVVPIRVTGEDSRVNDGGVVTTLLWEVTVLCLPTDIPDAIEVDVSTLGLDEVISVAELKLPEGIEIMDEADEAIVKVDIPSLELEATDDEDVEADDAEAEVEETSEEASEEE